MAFSKHTTDRGELRVQDHLEDLAAELAEYIAELSEVSVKERGVFAIALSGGSLISLMRKLSEAPYNKTVDWGKWYICWADERVVGKSHPDSNYKLAKEGLLCKQYITPHSKLPAWLPPEYFSFVAPAMINKMPVIPSHIHSINDSLSAEEAASEYEFVIRQLVKARTIAVSEVSDCPKFDLILLGMGPDGHIASLFPNHMALEEKDEWVTFITDAPKSPPERITFTLPVINSASNVAVVATGENKAEALRLAIDKVGPESPVVPARMVDPMSGKLVWFLDSAAASKLEAFKFGDSNQAFA